MDDRLDAIFAGLKQKTSAKQAIYRNTKNAFDQFKKVSIDLVKRLSDRVTSLDSSVLIEYRDVSEFEFHVKISGDLLVFVMHSNVVTFPEDYDLMKTEYVEADFKRRFFGHIMAYNFMADSIKYGRMNDPGYLLGRLLINIENHFYLEGVDQLNLRFQDLAQNVLNDESILLLVESAIIAAVNNDLMARDIDDLRVITVKQKLDNQQISRNQKVGFNFSYEASHDHD
ncbi:hypothetical protein I5M27_16605 [Adhaeribacter sp. BT258]|uniref:Uncharacterized protein n=1 Tax=Adhaeribacter terrigena TaxID=2793070 RepID=A0ABS1C5G9_9BACT|nr:hypothetical protein [Adhaeribacter terrigena]MBK0404619.1 hypothetical protein [Adhaeribacter terrigena]